MATIELKEFYAKNRAAWRKWLEKNHITSPGIWLIYYKKNSGKPRVEYDEAVEEALCFGWIDSIAQPIDADKFKQKFTPRNPKSVWSGLNKKRIEKLKAAGLMADAGIKAIDIAIENGSWTKLDQVENYEIPPDLMKVFNKNKKAYTFYLTMKPSPRKHLLYSLWNAKLPETRKRKIEEIMADIKGRMSK